MNKLVLIVKIQFSISTQFSSISPNIGPYQVLPLQTSGARSDGNNGVLSFTQSSSITETSPSDCVGSCTGHSSREPFPSAEMQLVYSATPAD